MQIQFECPQCHNYRITIINNDGYYRSFGINLSLAAICIVLLKIGAGMPIFNLAAIAGIVIFSVNAFSLMVQILKKREDSAVCKKCGYEYTSE